MRSLFTQRESAQTRPQRRAQLTALTESLPPEFFFRPASIHARHVRAFPPRGHGAFRPFCEELVSVSALVFSGNDKPSNQAFSEHIMGSNSLRSRLHTVRQIRRQRVAGIIGMAFVGAVLVFTATLARAQAQSEALMVRPGGWSQDAGGYVLPAALQSEPTHWPTDGWYRVTHKVGQLDVRAVPAPREELPSFLRDIALQINDPSGQHHPSGELEAEVIVDVDHASGTDEFLLLSSRAKPGKNPATATLSYSSPGC